MNSNAKPRFSKEEAKKEIVAAIIFYDGRGWDWWDVVRFLIAKSECNL